jgi:hypothetical protein
MKLVDIYGGNLKMITIGAFEAKTRLSSLRDRVAAASARAACVWSSRRF